MGRTQEQRQKLTSRQRLVLKAIEQTIARQGYAPSIRELGQMVGISSPNGIAMHLQVLEKKGFIRRDGAVARSIVVVPERKGPPGKRVRGTRRKKGFAMETTIERDRVSLAEAPGFTARGWDCWEVTGEGRGSLMGRKEIKAGLNESISAKEAARRFAEQWNEEGPGCVVHVAVVLWVTDQGAGTAQHYTVCVFRLEAREELVWN